MSSCKIHAPHSLSDQVRATLRDELAVFGRNISFEIQDAEVVLNGVVGSYYHKQMVQESLRGIEGVQRIDNRLRVVFR